MKSNTRYFLKVILLGSGIIPFTVSLLCAIPFFTGMGGFDKTLLYPIFIVYFSAAAFLAGKLTVKEYPDSFVKRYLPVSLPLILTLAVCAVCMVISKGFIGHGVFAALFIVEVAFFPMGFIMGLFGYYEFIFIVPLIYQAAFLLFFIIKERRTENKPILSKGFVAGFMSIIILSGVTSGGVMLLRRQTVLPQGYGFAYGGGFASVDIYRYDVQRSDNLLPLLEIPSTFTISDRHKMPVLDGAEAAYPVYSAFANVCYEGVANNPRYIVEDDEVIDKRAANVPTIADEKITFTNTIYAFERLVNGKVDIFFGAQPSRMQEELAKKAGKKLVLTPIGKEAFVFFVSNTNVCDNLTAQNIQDIYSGKVHNWVSITSADEKIYAFQRPENSGSQTIMQNIMGDVQLAEPLREEYVAAMSGVSERIADYRNYPGAIGYSFRFFITGMTDNADMIKLLSINDIAPTTENIASEVYPYTVSLYAITLEDNKLETISPFLEWMQGAEGQELIEKLGYVPVMQ